MLDTSKMRVAIVHYWLVGMRGGERVVEELCTLFPQAVIITNVADREKLSATILRHEIRETYIARLPGAQRHYQKYLPFMPRALEMVDMSEFDLVISSESGPSKGVICRPDALHICYCHSPMRYIWDHFHIYRRMAGPLARLVMPGVAHRLRIWDVTTAVRVDAFIANSHFVAQRIWSYYRRKAEVIHPPVAVKEFSVAPPSEVGNHYLLAGELASYKRADLAVQAFTQIGLPLRVIGDGDQNDRLRKLAGPNITFLGKLPFAQLKHEFSHCKALVFPGEEDFGIVPVEVMASGRPVIAFGRGGALDTVVPGVTGNLFTEQTIGSLAQAVYDFEAGHSSRMKPERLVSHAASFSNDRFRQQMKHAITVAYDRKFGPRSAEATEQDAAT